MSADRYREGFEDGWDRAKEQFRRELAERVLDAIKPVVVAPGSVVRTPRIARERPVYGEEDQ